MSARDFAGARRSPATNRSKWHPQGVSQHVASSVVSIPAIQHSILYLEGSHDPDMMSEVVPRFEQFERCCMAILFVGGQGKTPLHPWERAHRHMSVVITPSPPSSVSEG